MPFLTLNRKCIYLLINLFAYCLYNSFKLALFAAWRCVVPLFSSFLMPPPSLWLASGTQATNNNNNNRKLTWCRGCCDQLCPWFTLSILFWIFTEICAFQGVFSRWLKGFSHSETHDLCCLMYHWGLKIFKCAEMPEVHMKTHTS